MVADSAAEDTHAQHTPNHTTIPHHRVQEVFHLLLLLGAHMLTITPRLQHAPTMAPTCGSYEQHATVSLKQPFQACVGIGLVLNKQVAPITS